MYAKALWRSADEPTSVWNLSTDLKNKTNERDIYRYIYTHIHIHIYVYVYIYVYVLNAYK